MFAVNEVALSALTVKGTSPCAFTLAANVASTRTVRLP
jgi:hypothetical protein